MLQTVSVTLAGGDVQQVVPFLVSDQLQVVRRQVRLQGEVDVEEEKEKGGKNVCSKSQRFIPNTYLAPAFPSLASLPCILAPPL